MNEYDQSTHDEISNNKHIIQLSQNQPNNKPKMEKQQVEKPQKTKINDMHYSHVMLNTLDSKYLYQNLEEVKHDFQLLLNLFVKEIKKGGYSKKEGYAMRIYTLKWAMTCFKYSEQLEDRKFPVSSSIKNKLTRTLPNFLRELNGDKNS